MLDKGCGVQISKRKLKAKKRKISFILAILISIFVGGTCYYIKADKRSLRSYRYARWGMSLKECEEAVDKLNPQSKVVLEEDQKIICTIANYEGRKGIDALVSFICKEDGLEEIEVYLINRKGVSYTREQLIEEYIEMLDQLCGKHDKRLNTYNWIAQRSKIQVIDLVDKPVIVTYRWINKTLY